MSISSFENISLVKEYERCKTKYYEAHKQAYEINQNPWNDKQVIDLSNTWMQISETVSRCSFDSIQQVSILGTLSRVAPYFALLDTYRLIRGNAIWKKSPRGAWGLSFNDFIPQEYSDLFYKEGTPQSSWRSQYNAFCEKVQKCLGDSYKKALQENKAYAILVVKDEGPKTFKPNPVGYS